MEGILQKAPSLLLITSKSQAAELPAILATVKVFESKPNGNQKREMHGHGIALTAHSAKSHASPAKPPKKQLSAAKYHILLVEYCCIVFIMLLPHTF